MSRPLDEVEALIAAEQARQGGAPASRSANDQAVLQEIEALQRGPAGAAEPAAPPGGTFLGEIPRALGRGFGAGLELIADVAEAPLETRIPAGFAQGLPGLGEPPTPADAQEWFARNPQLQESAGDRLRRRAAEASGLSGLVERRLPRSDNPLVEGTLTAAEALGAGIAGGGWTAPARAATAFGALGAGTGRAAAEAADLGPMGRVLMEVAGEMLGGMSPGAARGVRDAFRRFRANQASPRIQELALDTIDRAIREHAPEGTDVDQLYAETARRIEDGEVSTLGTAFDTPGARGVEATAGMIPGVRPRLRQREEAVREQVVERLKTAEPEGDPTRALQTQMAATDAAQRRAAQTEEAAVRAAEATRGDRLRQATAELDEARSGARAARAQAEQAPDLEPAGLGADESLRAAREAAKDAENAAWAEVPKSVRVPTRGLRLRIAEVLRQVPAPERRQYRAANRQLLGEIRGLPKRVSGRNLISIERLVSDPPNAAEMPGYFDAINTQISKAILAHLDAQDELGDAFVAAREASKKRIRTFDTGIVGAARRATRDTPAELANKLAPTGPKGGETVRAAQRAGVDAQELLRAQFRAAAYDAAGEFRPGPAQTFLKNRRSALEAAGMRDEIQSIVEREARGVAAEKAFPATEAGIARTRDETVREAGRARQALSRQIEKSAPARFRGATPEAAASAAREAMTHPFAPTRIRQLVNVAQRQGAEAVRDLQRAFTDAFVADAVGTQGKGTTLVGDTAAKLARDRGNLQRVLSPEQMQRLDVAVEPLQRLKGVIAGVEKPDAARRTIGETVKQMLIRMAVVGSAGAVGVNSLIAANLASAQANQILRRIPQRNLERMLTEYVISPQKYLDDLSALQKRRMTPVEATEAVNRLLAVTAVGTAAATRDGED